MTAAMKEPGGVTLAGARVLVTGANRGLGKAFVEELLSSGVARVYAAARNPDTVESTTIGSSPFDWTSPSPTTSAPRRPAVPTSRC